MLNVAITEDLNYEGRHHVRAHHPGCVRHVAPNSPRGAKHRGNSDTPCKRRTQRNESRIEGPMSKPWLETWLAPDDDQDDQDANKGWRADTIEEARLFAAAPEMCRALLAVEYGAIHQGEYECPCCTMPPKHHHECALDKALTKAGLDTQEKRDDARKDLGL